MRTQRATILFMALFTCHLLFCTGCGSGQAKQVKIVLSYMPTGPGLLSDLRPATVFLKVVDERPPEQRDSIGVVRKTVAGTQYATVVSETSVVEVVYNVLKGELESSGHRVWNVEHQPCEIRMSVALTEFLVDSKADGTHIELIGQIRATVAASRASEEVPQVSFMVDSAYRDFVDMGWVRPILLGGLAGTLSHTTREKDVEKVTDGALAEFVRCVCLEPKLRWLFVKDRAQ